MLDDPVDMANDGKDSFKSVFNPRGEKFMMETVFPSSIKVDVVGTECPIRNLGPKKI